LQVIRDEPLERPAEGAIAVFETGGDVGFAQHVAEVDEHREHVRLTLGDVEELLQQARLAVAPGREERRVVAALGQ
jgi:hypothetical protein